MTFDDSDHAMQIPIVIDAAAVSNHQLSKHSKYIYHPLFNGKSGQWPPDNYEQYHCMHCGGMCDRGCPIPIVTRYDAKRNKYYVTDIHCSVNCCKGRILEINSFLMNMTTLLTGRMCQEVFKVDFAVMPAPPRLRLRIFGGDLTLEQFRLNFHTIRCTKEMTPYIMVENVVFEDLDVVAQHAHAVSDTDCCLPFIVDGKNDGDNQADFEMGIETMSTTNHRYAADSIGGGGGASTGSGADAGSGAGSGANTTQRIHATIRTHNAFHTVAAEQPMFELYKQERADKISKGENIDQFIPQKKSKKKTQKAASASHAKKN